MKIRSTFLCSLAAVLAACTQSTSEEVRAFSSQALQGSTACAVGANCAINLQYPNQLMAATNSPTQLPVVANGNLTVADRVQLQDSSGNLASLANVGKASTTIIGADARIGALWTNGSAFFGSRAYVAGTAWVGGTVQKQDPSVNIVGGTSTPKPGISGTSWNVTFPSSAATNIDLQPNTVQTIAPGRYGDISLKSSSTLTLTTGTYYFDSLDVEPQAILNLNNASGTIVIYVRGSIIHRGSYKFASGKSDVILASFGKDDIHLEAEFDGTLIAPYAKIVLGTANGATHAGVFYGQNVEVQAGSRVRYVPSKATGSAVDAINSTVVGDGTMTAPVAPSTTGVSFADYQKQLGNYLQSLIDQKYTGPTVQLPTHPDAQGAQNPNDPATLLPPSVTTQPLPPNTTITSIPLPATSNGTYADAKADAQKSINDAVAQTTQRLPEIDQTVPAPPVPPDPAPSTWATGFCPLEHTPAATGTPEERVSDSFFYGNTANPSKTFDAYWNASGNFAAGLSSLYMPYAQAAFQTSIGASLNLSSDPSKALVVDILKLHANAEAGPIVNDGRLLSVPYLKAGVSVVNKDVKSWTLPSDISSTKEDCRNALNDCQKKGGVYDTCCVHWYGLDANDPNSPSGNRVVNTDNCISTTTQPNLPNADECTTDVANCKAQGTKAAGCIDWWTLAIQPLKVDLWHDTIDFLDPPIMFPVGPFTITLNGGLEMGIPSYLAVDETGPDLTVAPFGRVFIKATAEVGEVIYVAVEGQIDVIRLDIPFKGSLKWSLNTSPEVCEAELHSNANVQTKWSTLNGKIILSFYMSFYDPIFGKTRHIEIAQQTLFSWNGFSASSDPWNLAQATNPIIKLDPNSCQLGGQSCSTDATPNQVISNLISTGEAFVQLPAPYGQKSCPGQAVVEFPDSSLGTAAGLFVESTWDQGQTTVDCAKRYSQYVVWVQLDSGKTDPAQTPSQYDNWHFYDQVTVSGSPQNGACIATVTSRFKELPASMQSTSFKSTPISYVDLQRSAASGRVTDVKVIAQATANCSELPLEFTVNPTFTAP